MIKTSLFLQCAAALAGFGRDRAMHVARRQGPDRPARHGTAPGHRWHLIAMGLLLVITCLVNRTAYAQQPDPAANWRSADSTHFRVHYRDTQRLQAEQVARAAERAFRRIAVTFDWRPEGRIELAVMSESGVANGFATPLPANLVGVFLAPPDGELLDNSPWLDLLLTHELVHVIHLDKVRGAPGQLRRIFGRTLYAFPNIFMPLWAIEGLATVHEGAQDGGAPAAAALGRGRLYGPNFEGWLRAQQARGFPTLEALNADGRDLPVSKAYLYGGYFFDFLARRYGAQAIPAYVENYSGNLVPRFQTNPVALTGKTMSVLWQEFLADLDAQLTQRAAGLRAEPEVLGAAISPVRFEISSVVGLPGGRVLAVVDDGVGARELLQFDDQGRPRRLATLGGVDARLDVNAQGQVLLTQADLCRNHYLSHDVYRVDVRSGRLQRLTHCAHLRRATQVGARIIALEVDAGRTRVVSLDLEGRDSRPVYSPAAGHDLVDLAPSAGGQGVLLVERRGGDWRLIELDLLPGAGAAAGKPRLHLSSTAPIRSPRAGAGSAGPEFVLAMNGVDNVWRLAGDRLQRLTHTHTGVLAHSGTQADGRLVTVVMVTDGMRMHRLDNPKALQVLAVTPQRGAPGVGTGWAAAPSPWPGAAPGASPAPPGPNTRAEAAPSRADEDMPALGADRPYRALESMRPRAWTPEIFFDRGLSAYGASFEGADALGWHRYALTMQWETSQREPIGSFEYVWRDRHQWALQRSVNATAWRDLGKGDYDTLAYERRTQAQWVSLLPLQVRLSSRVSAGLGAALDRTERIATSPVSRQTPLDDRLAAVLLDYDTREGNWWSEGPNRGLRITLLHESHRPFKRASNGTAGPGRDGHMTRFDLSSLVPIGRSVLALRHTEARASGLTRPFQLGGAGSQAPQFGYVLNQREVSLRGYRGTETALRGQNMRVSSIEWRTPIADVDWHGMAPPIGLNRLSGTAFVDAGGAWNPGASGPLRVRHGVGVEVLGELRLLYLQQVQLRLGVARGLDAPKGTVGYLSVGRAF